MGKRSKEANGEKASSGKKKKKTAATPTGEMTLSPATPTATTPRAPAAGRSPTGLTEGAFKAMAVHAHFSLLPHCLDDVRGHVFSLLQDALMRYAPDLEGVPVAVDNVALVPGRKHGRVYGIDPHVHVDVRLDATVFCPLPPQVLPGRVNAVAASYVGLLVHGSFNASIAKAELAGLEFDAANDRWADAAGATAVAVGTLVLFTLDKVHNADGILSFEGTFLRVVD